MTIVDSRNEPVGALIREDDACFFFATAPIAGGKMTEALTSETLLVPSRTLVPENLKFATMTQYDKSLGVPFTLTRSRCRRILGYVCGELHWKNLRVAENGKVCACDVLFQRWHREAVSRRRARDGGIGPRSLRTI